MRRENSRIFSRLRLSYVCAVKRYALGVIRLKINQIQIHVKMKKCSVIPRHLRLGLCLDHFPQVQTFQDVVTEVPVVDDQGQLVETRQVLVPTPADEVMFKYDYREFSLTKLTAAGVPLKAININPSRTSCISELYDACQSMENAENYVKLLDQQKRERDSWFTSNLAENQLNVELNEIS